jgi:nucleolar protein 9
MAVNVRDLSSYLVELARLVEDNSDAESVELALERAAQELAGKEHPVCATKEGSEAVEKLLGLAPLSWLEKFLESIAPAFEQVSCDVFGSHTMECLFANIQRHVTADSVAKLEEIVKLLRKSQETKLPSLLQDSHGTFALRALVRLASGQPVATQAPASKGQRQTQPTFPTSKKLSKELRKLLGNISDQMSSDDFYGLAFNNSACPTLQVIFQALRRSAKLRPILERFVPAAEDENAAARFQELVSHPVASHLLEHVLEAADDELYSLLYSRFFRGKEIEFCRDAVANFVVQRLIACTRDGPQVEMLFDALAPHFPELLSSMRGGVVLKLIEACQQKGVCQEKMVKRFVGTLESVRKQQEPAIVTLLSTGNVQGENYSRMGCMIAQTLFRFNTSNRFLTESFLSLDTKIIKEMARDMAGSRLLEAFLDHCPHNLRKKFIEKLHAHFAELASHKCASHVVEKCYAVADLQQKEKIAAELAADKSLGSNVFGRFILKNCKVYKFQQKNSKWQAAEEANDRKRKLFEDFFNDEEENVREDAVEPQPEPLLATAEASKQSKKLKQKKFKKRKNEYDSDSGDDGELEVDADADPGANPPADLLQLVQESEKKFGGPGSKRKKSK